MSTFIRVIEVWKLSRHGSRLELEAGMYGDLDDFRWESERTGFKWAEGLPGRAWSEQRPILLTDLREPYFRRASEARRADLRAAIAIPVFVGDFLMGVVTMLCAEGFVGGALEIWSARDTGRIALDDGYYGALQSLETSSRSLEFDEGKGLPGLALSRLEPVLASPLALSPEFERQQIAGEVAVTTGVALPVTDRAGHGSAVVFLSAPHTPIARTFELWRPRGNAGLELVQGSEGNDSFYDKVRTLDMRTADGFLGRAWASGGPALCEDLGRDGSRYAHWACSNGLRSACAIPFSSGGRLTTLLTLTM